MRMPFNRRITVEPLEPRRHLHAGDDHAADNFGVNAGGPEYVDSTGVEYEADRGFSTSSTAQTVSTTAAVANTDLDPLFQTARQDYNLKFHSDLPNGKYDVKLLFSEQRMSAKGQRVFSVDLEGARVLTDFDVFAAAGGKNKAITKAFTATVTDGQLNVDFVTGSTRAMISAIRVEPAQLTDPDPDVTIHGDAITWATKKAAPLKREEAVSFGSGGKLYVIGGYINGKFQATRSVDVYDPTTNTWSKKKDAPTKITHTGLAVDPATGDVWMCGGFIGDFPSPPGTAAVWKYTPSTDTWTSQTPLPSPRGAGGAGIIGDTLYFVSGSDAGRDADTTTCFSLDITDPAAQWQSVAPIPVARNHFGCVALGGKLYAIGGQSGLEGQSVSKASVYVYDPSKDEWFETTAMPRAYSHFTSTLSVYKDRYIVIAGGESAHNQAIADVMLFDSVTRKWARLKSLPAARRAAAGGVIGNTYVVTGGYKYGSNQLADTWTSDLTKLGV